MLNTKKIKARIIELGLTQKVIAKELGVKQCTLSQKISNVRPLTLDEAEQLQKILSIPDQDFRVYFFSSMSCQNATHQK